MPNAAQPAAQPTAPASLDDMMTALQRADSLGHAEDAQKIAQMLQEAYPHHVEAALAMTPSMGYVPMAGAPVHVGFGGSAYGMSPAQMNPTPMTPPDYSAVGPGAPPQGSTGAPQTPPPGGGSSQTAPAPASGAPSASANPPHAGGLGQDIADFGNAAVNALGLRSFASNAVPGGNYLAAGMSQAMGGQGPGGALSAAGPLGVAAGSAINTAAGALGIGSGAADFAARKAQIDNAEAAAARSNPVASTIGGMAGTAAALTEGGAAVKALGAAGVPLASPVANWLGRGAEALGNTEGGTAKRVFRAIVAGAIGGGAAGVNDVATGHTAVADAPEHIAVDAAFGGTVGPVLGKLASKGWEYLANKINQSGILGGGAGEAAGALADAGVTGDDLAALHANAVKANNGQPVPIAQVLTAAQRAKLASVAGKTPVVGNALSDIAATQATDAQTHVPDMLAQAGSATPAALSPTGKAGVQTLGEVENGVTAKMNAAMGDINDPAALRNQRVALKPGDEDVLMHPNVASAMNRATDADRQGYATVINELQNGNPASVSIHGLDSLRQSIANQFGPDKIANDLVAQAAAGLKGIYSRNSAYTDALATNANHEAFLEGFTKGQSGNPISAIKGATALANSAKTGAAFQAGHGSGLLSGLAQTALESPTGAAGVLKSVLTDTPLRAALAQAHGAQALGTLTGKARGLSTLMQNTRDIAPKSPVGEAPPPSETGDAMHAVAAGALGHHWAIARALISAVSKSLGIGHGGMSDPAGNKLTSMLMSDDPRVQQQTIEILRAHGANEADLARIRTVANMAAGASAARIGNQQ